MINLNDILLWGVPLVGIVNGLMNFLRWAWKGIPSQVDKIIGGLFTAGGFLLVKFLPELIGQYPMLNEYGQWVLWALVAFLVYTGHFPGVAQLKRAARKLA